MTHEIHIHRADAIRSVDGPVNPVVIHVDRDQATSGAVGAAAMFKADSKAIADALWESLPGGTLSELIAELLERRSCQFRVRMPQEAGQ